MKTKLMIILGLFASLYLASWLEYWQRPVGLRDLIEHREVK